ncbi:MAG: ATP-dependent DNA helicase [Gammaproteobacteria bacterium]|nr:ATP-dependent DNA helicase [Gammaproteobacteria bacterium]
MAKLRSALRREVARVFADRAPFAAHLPDYRPRAAQAEMADCVATFLERSGDCVFEAGTGIGKSLAYLVPALSASSRTIVSTGTKTLQDQLYLKDVPIARAVTGSSAQVAVLKGRGNYLCRYRFERTFGELALAPQQRHELELLRAWHAATVTGDISEATGVPEQSPLWPRVTSTTDNCLGSKCPLVQDCFVFRARRQAFAADLIIVNHHLLLAELLLRQAGQGEILAAVDAVICDEAHQLPDVAALFFGVNLSSRQLLEFCHETLRLDEEQRPLIAEALRLVRELEQVALAAAGERSEHDAEAQHASSLRVARDLSGALMQVRDRLIQLEGRDEDTDLCLTRAGRLLVDLHTYRAADADWARWTEPAGQGVVLHATPLEPGDLFERVRPLLADRWLFTSATLAVGEDLDYFCKRLGIVDATCATWPSPFDYPRHALLYLPTLTHEPNDADYLTEALAAAVPLLRASRGRAFFLFTSHRALRFAAERLPALLPREYAVLVQGTQPKASLLEHFRALAQPILLGTMTFWEGVDVRGPALSLVIIDKLPFTAPEQPVLRARVNRLRAQGRDPFREIQMPEAVLTLKQGAGRLIRDAADQGVLMICDPRLVTRAYGRRFLAALPPMRRTTDRGEAEEFLRGL